MVGWPVYTMHYRNRVPGAIDIDTNVNQWHAMLANNNWSILLLWRYFRCRRWERGRFHGRCWSAAATHILTTYGTSPAIQANIIMLRWQNHCHGLPMNITQPLVDTVNVKFMLAREKSKFVFWRIFTCNTTCMLCLLYRAGERRWYELSNST